MIRLILSGDELALVASLAESYEPDSLSESEALDSLIIKLGRLGVLSSPYSRKP